MHVRLKKTNRHYVFMIIRINIYCFPISLALWRRSVSSVGHVLIFRLNSFSSAVCPDQWRNSSVCWRSSLVLISTTPLHRLFTCSHNRGHDTRVTLLASDSLLTLHMYISHYRSVSPSSSSSANRRTRILNTLSCFCRRAGYDSTQISLSWPLFPCASHLTLHNSSRIYNQ
jgi:hypothetical protein